MAEDKNPDQEGAKKGSGLVMKIVGGLLVVVVPAVLAVLVWLMILQPLMQAGPEAPVETPTDLIPATHAMVEFDEVNLPILPDDPDTAAPLLTYQVAMACSSPEVQLVINNNLSWFIAKINELHQNKTRSELNDPYVKNTLKKQIRQEANTLIQRLVPDLDGEVIEAMYLKYGIMDL
jgi:flagellar basal body-associated protein FliL